MSTTNTDAPRLQSRPQSPAFWVALTLLGIFALGALYVSAKLTRRGYRAYVAWQGVRLNRSAWEGGYLERNLPVPPDGPRDGYWGIRLGQQVKDPELGWVLPKLDIPGLLEIDALGMQHYEPPVAPRAHILIIGASVAFGGYASTIEHTYYYELGERLAAGQFPARLTVYATGAWKSSQEVQALALHGLALDPDVVLFLNGLNDLTNGSNAHVRYGVQTVTLDGSRWHPLYHEHDYPARVETYLANLRTAYDELHRAGVPMVVALQPALFEKAHLSAIEARVQRQALQYFGPKNQLLAAYESTRQRLAQLARNPGLYFIDCSRALSRETVTTFTDTWHFSDPGHALLAAAIANTLLGILREVAAPHAGSVPRPGGKP